jgi:phosphate/sulfate permease
MLGKKGQVSMFLIWMVIAVIGLVVAGLILFFVKDTGNNYLSRLYDCIRFGGSCWG